MKYQCPCCGFYTLEENASGEICPVCFWERDKASEEEPGFEGGANNGISLNQARKNYVSFGACDEKLVTYVRAPKEEEKTSGPSVEDQQERLEKQMNFILEIDKEKLVTRQTSLTNHGRKENDAEHAWHMAVMCYLLKEYANEEFDMAHAMMMCLIHDIVEIDAGDTYAYDEAGRKTQREREAKAKDRIFALLPEEQGAELKAIFEEFEENETAEARFVHAMDNFQPILLNNSNGGQNWMEHGVAASQVMNRQKKTRPGSEPLYQKIVEIINQNVEKGSLKDE